MLYVGSPSDGFYCTSGSPEDARDEASVAPNASSRTQWAWAVLTSESSKGVPKVQRPFVSLCNQGQYYVRIFEAFWDPRGPDLWNLPCGIG